MYSFKCPPCLVLHYLFIAVLLFLYLYIYSALHWSIDRNHLLLSEYLLQQGASVNIQDTEGQTALHIATVCEERPLIALLLRYGADVNIKNNDDETVFDIADTELKTWIQQHTQQTKKAD